MDINRLKNIGEKWVKKHNVGEKWERSFFAALLLFFVVFGVLFFIFIIPKIDSKFSILNGSGKNIPAEQGELDPAKNFSIGVKLSGDKEYSQALEYFQKAVEKDPENASYLNELAATYYKLKNYDEALRAYDTLILIDGNNESVYDNRIANIHWIRKEYGLAEAYFRKAIEKDPQAGISYNNLALMLNEENRRDDAMKLLKEGISKGGGKELEATILIIKGQK